MARFSADKVEILIVCALSLEADAVRAVLDEQIDGFRTESNDDNTYTVGRIGIHYVAIVHLAGMGSLAAATAVARALVTFPSTQLALVVGICGVVPASDPVRGPQHCLYLGDLIISTLVVQYDFGKQYPVEFKHHTAIEHNLGRPSTRIRSLLQKLEGLAARKDMESALTSDLIRLSARDSRYLRPDPTTDRLFPAHYAHLHRKPVEDLCTICADAAQTACEDAQTADCVAVGCDISQAVVRHSRSSESLETQDTPAIHFGKIGSANLVMKSGVDRDRWAKELGVIAFEMEGAGVWDTCPTLVVKAACDYADSHKNKSWQNYAAGVAATGAKAFLHHWPPRGRGQHKRDETQVNEHWMVPRSVSVNFTGRQEVVRSIEDTLLRHQIDADAERSCRIVLTGPGGQGKSEVCLRLANRIRQQFWGIFWIDVSTPAQAEKGLIEMASQIGRAATSSKEALIALANIPKPWILFLDNADDINVNYDDYLPTGNYGYVIMTTRNPDCKRYASSIACIHRVDGLRDAEAIELLLKSADINERSHADCLESAAKITILLANHTLAIVLAGAYISQGFCTLETYPQHYQESNGGLLHYEEAQAPSRYGSVSATFEVSLAMLRSSRDRRSGDALDLLNVMAMLAWNAFPLSVFEQARRSASDITYLGPTAHNDCRQLKRRHAEIFLDPPAANHSEGGSEMTRHRHGHRRQRRRRSSQGSSSGSDADGSRANSSFLDRIALIQAIQLLRRLALITDTGHRDDCISMHPLTHEWARHRLSDAQKGRWWLKAACLLGLSGRHDGFADKDARLLVPHLTTLIAQQPVEPLREDNDCTLKDLYYSFAVLLHDLTMFEECRSFLTSHTRSPDQPEQQDELHDWPLSFMLARIHSACGSPAAATATIDRILEAFQKHNVPRTHPDMLMLHAERGHSQNLDRRWEQAISELVPVEVACAAGLSVTDYSHTEVLEILATAYLSASQVTRAIELLERVERTETATCEPSEEPLLRARSTLAQAYVRAGRCSEAIALLKKVLEHAPERLADNHVEVLAWSHALGYAYLENDEPSEAIAILEHVVSAKSKLLAITHPRLLASQSELARAYLGVDDSAQALPILRHVVKIRSKTLWDGHPDLLASQATFAVALWENGQHDLAFDLLKDVVQHHDLLSPPDDELRNRAEAQLAAYEIARRVEGQQLPEGVQASPMEAHASRQDFA